MKREIGLKNYDFPKMRGMNVKKARLLQVFRVKKGGLSKAFVEYNHAYFLNGKKRYYKTADTAMLVLLLQDLKTKHIFTTVRKDNPENRARFLKDTGKIFDILRD